MQEKSKKYKMIVMDMDYTLLNKEKQVSKRNREALKEAEDRGVKLVIATGRIYVSARFYARLLSISTPIIASNGAIIKEYKGKKVVYQSFLEDDAAIEMARLCRKHGLYCHLFTHNKIYSEKLVNVSTRYTKWNEELEDEDKIAVVVTDSLERVINEDREKFLKAVVVDEDGERIRFIRDEIMEKYNLSASRSLRNNLEVMNKDVNKGNAVKILSQLYGIKREEIMAIGDNENDMSMIEYAGMGVAMDNAEDYVKEKADYVTGDYQDDGVAQAIEKFVL